MAVVVGLLMLEGGKVTDHGRRSVVTIPPVRGDLQVLTIEL